MGELLESDRSVRGVKAVISTTSTHTQSHQEGEGKGKEKEAEEEEIIGWALWKYYLDDPETRKEKELVPPEGCPCPELFYESFGRFREIKVEIMRGRRYICMSHPFPSFSLFPYPLLPHIIYPYLHTFMIYGVQHDKIQYDIPPNKKKIKK